jgi:hypothetical protein
MSRHHTGEAAVELRRSGLRTPLLFEHVTQHPVVAELCG